MPIELGIDAGCVGDNQRDFVGPSLNRPQGRRSLWIGLATAAALLASVTVFSQTTGVRQQGLIQFISGTPANAEEVNHNFALLEDRSRRKTVITRDPTDEVELSDSNEMADMPGVVISFSVDESTTFIANYQITAYRGINEEGFLVTQSTVDDDVVHKNISGTTHYWGNSGTYMGEAAPGTHTIKVRYRSNVGGISKPSLEYHQRSLQVMLFGPAQEL